MSADGHGHDASEGICSIVLAALVAVPVLLVLLAVRLARGGRRG